MALIHLPSGATIWYRKSGSGAPLLQIHGSAFGHRNFEKMTPLMAPHFETIDFDLPGYGESRGGPGFPAKPDMADIADLVHEFLQALGCGPVHLHGTSFGAMIGLTLAARHPDDVRKLVFSCFLARYDNAARMMRGTWKRAALDSGMAAVADLTSVAGFARSYYDRPEAQAQLQAMRDAFMATVPAAFVAGTESIERTDLSPLVPKLRAPVLLLGGDEDNMTPFKPSDSGVGFAQMKELLPQARLVVLPQCGHYLVIEQPEQAASLIVDFIGA